MSIKEREPWWQQRTFTAPVLYTLSASLSFEILWKAFLLWFKHSRIMTFLYLLHLTCSVDYEQDRYFTSPQDGNRDDKSSGNGWACTVNCSLFLSNQNASGSSGVHDYVYREQGHLETFSGLVIFYVGTLFCAVIYNVHFHNVERLSKLLDMKQVVLYTKWVTDGLLAKSVEWDFRKVCMKKQWW